MRLQKIEVTAAAAAAAANNGGAFDSRCVLRVSSSPVSPASTKWKKVLKSKRGSRGEGKAFVLVMMASVGGGTAGLSCRIGGELSASFQQTAERLRPSNHSPPSVGGKGNKFVPVQVNAPIASVDRIVRGFMCALALSLGW